MGQQNRIAPWVVLVVMFVALQGALIAADCIQTPVTVAKQFAKNFYALDNAMDEQLCGDLIEHEAVDAYLYSRQDEANLRGLPQSYLSHMFTELHLDVVDEDDTRATIHIKGKTRVAINRVYMLIGQFFFMTDTYPVDATLELIKENGSWKVCGEPFGMKIDA